MQSEIHPTYGPTTYQCSCGAVHESGSTSPGTTRVDVCSACHPFYTGQTRVLDTAGRVQKFNEKYGKRAR